MHGSYFPLFARSVEHNETIDGLDMAMLQMKRERCRRKREKLLALDPALSQKLLDFARSKEAENLDIDAGYEEAPADELSPKNTSWAQSALGQQFRGKPVPRSTMYPQARTI